MPILQVVITGIVLISFFMAFFILAWYVVLPLLFVWAVFGGVRWLKSQWDHYQDYRSANGCTIRRTESPGSRTRTTVIDVDYTEIK